MRFLALGLVAALNGALLWGWRGEERRREELLRLRAEAERRGEATREASARWRDVEALLERARRRLSAGELDIDVLRDLLLEAERGLDIDRLSLEFQPEPSGASRASGTTIQASLRGTFEGVGRYLGRVESLRLPLSPQELSLRRPTDGGGLLLTIRWSGGAADRAAPSGAFTFTSSEIEELDRWLAREPSPLPERNLFARAETVYAPEAAREDEEPPGAAPPAPAVAEAASAPSVPRLTGYVLARPELEADASRRVLAALRFEGELRLVKVGDLVGSFRVERIEPRESVVLVDERTGERVKLFFE